MRPDPKERARRLAAEGLRQGLDLIMVTTAPNLYYFSGFRTTLYTRFNAVMIPTRNPDDTSVITSYIDEKLAKEPIWSPVWWDRVAVWGPIQREDVVPTHWDALQPHLSGGLRVGVDEVSFPFVQELTERFPGLEVRNVSPAIEALKRVKDSFEVEQIRAANHLALQVVCQVKDWMREPGMTERELGLRLESEARRRGADGWAYPVLISVGEKIKAPHSPPLDHPITPDLPFLRVAFGPQFNGYSADVVRTFTMGRPSAEMQRFADAYWHARDAAVRCLKPGATVQEVLAAVRQAYTEKDVLAYWGGDMGHGLGLTVHEGPRIGGTDNTPLVEGMVLAVEPGLRRPDHATFHHCDVYRVTAGGCECLSPDLHELIVV